MQYTIQGDCWSFKEGKLFFLKLNCQVWGWWKAVDGLYFNNKIKQNTNKNYKPAQDCKDKEKTRQVTRQNNQKTRWETQSTGEQMTQRNTHDKPCSHNKHDKKLHMASKTNHKQCDMKNNENTHEPQLFTQNMTTSWKHTSKTRCVLHIDSKRNTLHTSWNQLQIAL